MLTALQPGSIYIRFIELCEDGLYPWFRVGERIRRTYPVVECSRTCLPAGLEHKEERILDILQLRVRLDTFDQLRLCQTKPRGDCHAAFTVTGMQVTWPVASWQEIPQTERVNVRGWFPLLDQISDEFLIWRPQGGCFFVFRDRVTYWVSQSDAHGVLFLQLELSRPAAVPVRRVEPRAYARR